MKIVTAWRDLDSTEVILKPRALIRNGDFELH